ncbi:MAG: hypothetical protein HY330_04825 [Chloroflexi bacterium]|nr:hypothetical protein [Chloroflexota bacterium]
MARRVLWLTLALFLGLALVACLGPGVAAAPARRASQATPTPAPAQAPAATALPRPTPTPLPVAKIGDTVQGVGQYYSLPGMSLTLLSVQESPIAVAGPYYGSYYYTYTAWPGMKFVVLSYRFTNSWVRQQTTRSLLRGEVQTAPKGYYYGVWYPPANANVAGYQWRYATAAEISRLGANNAGLIPLLPEQAAVGRVVFEVPADARPTEVRLFGLPARISLQIQR